MNTDHCTASETKENGKMKTETGLEGHRACMGEK
jgi:hypothetical protein